MSDTSAVLLAGPELPEVPVLVKALAAARGIPMIDAAHAARSSWGLIAESVPETEAQALITALGANGVSAFATPSDSLVAARAPNVVRKIAPRDEGLQVEAVRAGDVRTVPWPLVALVAVGAIKKTSSRTVRTKEGPSAGAKLAATGIMLATGIPLPMGRTRVVEKRVEDTTFSCVLDVFLKDAYLRMRVDPETLDYSCLGKEKGYGAWVNFGRFLAMLLARAPGARRNLGARRVLEGKSATALGYEHEAELNRECSWLLTLLRLGR